MDEGACIRIEDPDIFFPPRDKSLYKVVAAEAKGYCYGTDDTPPCPVRSTCLLEAIEQDEPHGIWGGLSHRERNALVRKWQKQYKGSMTLVAYIKGLEEKENDSKKRRLEEVSRRQEGA